MVVFFLGILFGMHSLTFMVIQCQMLMPWRGFQLNTSWVEDAGGTGEPDQTGVTLS